MPSSALRARLAATLGLAGLFPLLDLHAAAETGGSGAPSGTGNSPTAYCEVAPAVTTPGELPQCGAEPSGDLEASGCTIVEVFGDGVYDPDTGDCCWKVEMECYQPKYCNGCYGRPLVVDGRVQSAGSVRRRGWCAPDVAPARVAAEHRPALVRFWLENAEAEHSSIAGFAKFALDLLAVGAPAALVARAHAAGMEELEHARACYALASAYAGFPLGPRALETPPIRLAADLVELAAQTAREGCVGETVAAALAEELASTATDPAVRAVLRAIAEEEARHAELAWETVAWAIRMRGDAARDAVAAVFAEGLPAQATGETPDRPELRAHGLIPDEEQAAIRTRAFEETVRPLAAALLSRALDSRAA